MITMFEGLPIRELAVKIDDFVTTIRTSTNTISALFEHSGFEENWIADLYDEIDYFVDNDVFNNAEYEDLVWWINKNIDEQVKPII